MVDMPDWEEVLIDSYLETYEIETDDDDEEIGADWDPMASWDLDGDEEDEGEDGEDDC